MNEHDLKRLLDANAAETRSHFDASLQRVEKKMDASVEETRRHFDATAERLEHAFRLVVEAVAQSDEKLDHESEDIRQECAADSPTHRP